MTYEDAEELTMLDRDAEPVTEGDVNWYVHNVLAESEGVTEEEWGAFFESTFDPDLG